MPKNWKGGPVGVFQHPFCRKTAKKWKGGPLGEKIFQKSLAVPKKLKGGPFGLARYGMLRGKTGKIFLVQFARPNGAIIFCRTFKNYFGQFVWIKKGEKKVTIKVAFHFMKSRLKIEEIFWNFFGKRFYEGLR